MAAVTSRPAWAPEISDFSGAPGAVARLFMTPQERDRARHRAKEAPWARPIVETLIKDAEDALRLELKPIDERWWQRAQTQPWESTYPVVFEFTQRQPSRLARAASQCALAWVITDETRYADRACDLLLLLAPYSFAPQHFDVGMNYTTWGIDLLRTYDLLGTRLSSAERAQVDAGMTRLARAVMQNDIYWIENDIGGGINNHLAWHKLMLGLLGLFYDRTELVQSAIEGRRGMLPLLGDGLVDNGLWCESSLNYHFTAIVPLMLMADCQRRLGRRPNVTGLEGTNGRTLKQPFDAMLDVLFPDGSIPPVGDCYAHRARLADNPIYEYGWSAWGDPRYAWLLKRARQRNVLALFTPDLSDADTAPRGESILLPEHGYVFLREAGGGQEHRDYWDAGSRCAFFTFDRAGVHAHADRLSFMYFAEGALLLADREARATAPHAFSSDVQRQLNRSTICQNTVTIDGHDQRSPRETLRLVEYHVTPGEQRVSAADVKGLLFEHVAQMRTIVLAPEYVLDVFQIGAGTTTRQIDWIAHPFEEASQLTTDTIRSLAELKPQAFPQTVPWNWLRDPRRAAARRAGDMEWESDALRLRLTFAASEPVQPIVCGFPVSDEPKAETRSMLMLRANTPRLTLAAVWTAGNAPLQVAIEASDGADLRFRIRWGDRSREHSVPRLEQITA